MDLFVLVPIFGVVALLYTFLQSNWVSRQNAGNEKMKIISGHIADGAMAFLKAEYRILTYFVVVVAILLAVMGSSNANSHWSIGVAFAVGAVFSALAGFIGMKIATKANVRTAEAAKTSLSKALKVSFTGGSVMGMGVAGLAVLGLGALFLIIRQIFAPEATVDSHEMERTIEILTGFSLGAESIALFARVGGGIYTKAADVGADLVGKVEAGIPEDDPRNPATIADNVGDNVGDVAGMGADLFGSYVATVLATMVLGRETISDDAFGGFAPILLPMLIAGTGILFSMVGTLFVRINDNEGSSTSSVQNALNLGNWGSIVITAIASYFLVTYTLPETMTLRGHEFTKMGVFGAIMVGLVVGTLMSIITEYYTAMGKRPVSSIVRQSSTGHATNIIGGLSVGMESTLLPIIVLAGGIYGSYLCAGLYGVAIAAAGMMATTAMQLAIDAFGPIADNAGGIAEMSELPKEVREKTDILDAVGNTTAATGKGFAIASAALTALALFAAFVGIAGIDGIDIYRADVLAGLFVGGMIPFIFSSLAITAVGQAAMAMVEEVRRQFREIPGILEGKAQPEYEKCVAISTDASIRKMMLPGAIAIISPLLIGFIFGPEVLGGFLAGATVCGVLMGMFQNNAGGAWDNAKKSFEKGVDINGQTYYKGSEPHKASVTGDTVGDPFKDTSGPSMNILIKLMSIVSLVIAPTLAVLHKDKIEANRKAKIESLTGVSQGSSSTVNVDLKTISASPGEIKGHLNENGDFVYETGNIQEIKLKGGKTIAIGEGSKVYQFYNAVKKKEASALNPDQWYTIENLYFETGSSDLKTGSEVQLNNLAEILNAYPDLKIKLGGYTDNTGNEESNQKLSNLRAQTAKLKLLELGIGSDRVEAEGYGSQHPVCEANDTDECKAKNRRIDVRILAL
ncbi:MAG: sodium-translocating pyrophosphatase [Chryseobacterium sp.]|jgi:K(+)-stimulated pyrophosphate-energized sodium pump|uniref:sodium-translocating pyrophosphatase n=1 Tax=Chryseobacterium sp. TaxID=1871047 RepID=UPI0028217703|nr:sodium-translocating pyrophosphatase [Chryseobacterium sp.]MDR2235786.1 sodium-translocating pyrophosphatase [Chryseobacterium sp.]